MSQGMKISVPYTELSPTDFIKWLANHRGGHAFQLKSCAEKWLHAQRERDIAAGVLDGRSRRERRAAGMTDGQTPA